ncbi:hypothetical protein CCY97_04460 [Helicobacter sp. 10-6591]|nr:hypothetical protein CCY97_04460 [Helicobacter sp. 10-6591]
MDQRSITPCRKIGFTPTEKLITCFKVFLQDWQVLNHYTYFNKIKNFNSLLIFHLLKTSKEE